MKTKTTGYLPFTKSEIITLRGKPNAKRIQAGADVSSPFFEEWIYYNMDKQTKEYYIFSNNKFIDWKKTNLELPVAYDRGNKKLRLEN